MSNALSKVKTGLSYIPTPFKANAAVEGVKMLNENAGNALGGLLDILTGDPADPALDNPYFTQNGHEGASPATSRYMAMSLRMKMIGTMAVAIGDVGGVVSAGQALAGGAMWFKINALFQKLVPPSRRSKPVVYGAWYSWAVAHKAVPAGSLETKMNALMKQKLYGSVGNATKAGITFYTGGFTGYFVNSAAAVFAPFLDRWLGQDTQTLAQGLHWFAFLELVVGRGQGTGPSLRILEVIWTELSFGRASMPKLHDVVREPRGWLVIADLIA